MTGSNELHLVSELLAQINLNSLAFIGSHYAQQSAKTLFTNQRRYFMFLWDVSGQIDDDKVYVSAFL